MIGALNRAAAHGVKLGLSVHAGHGLTLANVGAVARIPEIEELSIGHSIVSRSVFVGIAEAVREMRDAIQRARGGTGPG
jgi:pyridoxine 5-phosphate synthase